MTYRTFTDTDGRKWEVWLVIPTSADRRTSDRRSQRDRRVAVREGSPERRRVVRRSRAEPVPSLVAPDYEKGWLCFESHGEKRRLTPVPAQWERAASAQLSAWCDRARRVVRLGADG